MSPATLINVTVVGTEERAYREFRAKVITIYTDEEGFGWSRYLASVEGAVNRQSHFFKYQAHINSTFFSSRSKQP